MYKLRTGGVYLAGNARHLVGSAVSKGITTTTTTINNTTITIRSSSSICVQPIARLARFVPQQTVARRAMNTLATGPTRLAVLHQAIDPPVIDGVRKPAKPGGYQDSGADIASCLRANSRSRIEVITPTADPDPRVQTGWTFPDTEEGILDALDRGATHLWANTILFAAHPLQTSEEIGRRSASAAGAGGLRVVGQPPALVERYDDKRWVNDMLRRRAREGEDFTLPRSWTLSAGDGAGDWEGHVERLDLPYPVVGKPIRGRGSHGVKVCRDRAELVNHVRGLFVEEEGEGSAGGSVLVEEYLGGEEATVAVMPPTRADPAYRALPVVTRFNHRDGIAPYSGEVAVSVNSRAVLYGEGEGGGGGGEAAAYGEAQRQCERVAAVLGVTAPIRIDVRRFGEEAGSPFALFDVNMKPNMTGPGRPGRDEQASLVLLAAQALGWDYARLLETIVGTANTLEVLRSRTACE